MAFPQRFLDELTARNDIVDVVGHYVELTRKGNNHFGLCPFHNEKTGSFSVSQEKQIYHCFGCKKGGGVINFIMEIENLSFPDAVRFLAERVHMEVPEDDGGDSGQYRRRLLQLNRDAARFYYETLHSPAGEAALRYVEKRRISKKTATDFGLGAAPDAWDALTLAMLEKGYTRRELVTVGLSVEGKGGRLYDKFRNRLMFPVIDVRGDVIAFGGRVLGAGEPKYMNTSETPVYSKRRSLYGINLAKKTRRPQIILCEGNIDVVMMHQAGFDNAVASMGTALTVEQTRLLSRYTKELVLCYDNDGAGEAATAKALAILNRSEFSVKVLRLPKRLQDGAWVKQDPDDFIKYQGKDAFEHLLSGSENGVEFRMARIAERHDMQDDREKVAYAAEVSELLATLPSPVEREVYARKAAAAAGISAEAMQMELQRSLRRLKREQKRADDRTVLNPGTRLQPKEHTLRYDNLRSALAEEGLIRLLMQEQSLFGQTPPVESRCFSSETLGRIYDGLWRFHAEGRTLSVPLLSAALTPEEMSLFTELMQKPEDLRQGEKALGDYVRVIRTEYEKRSASSDADPLALALEKNKNKSTYGGKKS